MFSSAGLFKAIKCPNADACRLPRCIFSHEPSLAVLPKASAANSSAAGQSPEWTSAASGEPDAKRRKLDNGTLTSAVPELRDASPAPSSKPQAFYGALPSTRKTNDAARDASHPPKKPLQSALRPVSPPPKAARPPAQAGNKATQAKSTKETLNPRMVANDPAGHNVRFVLLKKLHEGMARLNEEVSQSGDAEVQKLHLKPDELIRTALDEEEQIVKEHNSVYSNIIKMRILKYSKKMKVDEWVELRREAIKKASKSDASDKPEEAPPIETGLSSTEELSLLPKLVADQTNISQWGYVTTPPSEADIEKARQGVESARGYEECDRCQSRFQVFPDRREDDGALTSGGMCIHHPMRRYFPPRSKGDKGPVVARYGCCQAELGAPGCTTAATHVFKISEAKRLALVMPFIETPPNPSVQGGEAVCFDCEMGYTCYGLELIRLTAVTWPSGKPLIDVLVKPIGTILDLNSRFSGVHPEPFASALECKPGLDTTPYPKGKDDPLRIVPSPEAARALLLSHLSPSTPLLGHALENDLNAIRLVHPCIVDTVMLYPHPRGLPMRFGLRALSERFLHRKIQTAGAAGHDSLEDARATGDLVRAKIGQEWKRLRLDGWSVKGGEFYAPLAETPGEVPDFWGGGKVSAGAKRKRVDGGEEVEEKV